MDRRIVWSVQMGFGGRWRPASGPHRDRDEAVARLEWYRAHAAPAVAYRLARETTRVTTAFEDL